MKRLLLPFLLLGLPTMAGAQMLLVTSEYRVTEIDEENLRFGVALPESKGAETQNWVYLEAKSSIHTLRSGDLDYARFLQVVKPGRVVKVHGGRRWDGGISGKEVWLTTP